MWNFQTIAYDGTITWYAYDADGMTDEQWSAIIADFDSMVTTRQIARWRVM